LSSTLGLVCLARLLLHGAKLCFFLFLQGEQVVCLLLHGAKLCFFLLLQGAQEALGATLCFFLFRQEALVITGSLIAASRSFCGIGFLR
jgi:hypothetical protein